MADFAEVSFKGTRKGYFAYEALDLVPGAPVIVEAGRGEDLGEITALGSIAERKCETSGGCATPLPKRRVLRVARQTERVGMEELRADETRVRTETRKLVKRHKLNMKITEAEWQFDKNKLIIYFTADRRVDFRELVRSLARTFRTRIELKQIGVRDEAALLGGVGRCGRELCSSVWLPALKPVSLQLAKDQKLSLNPAQISGAVGASCVASCTSTRPTWRHAADSPGRARPFVRPWEKRRWSASKSCTRPSHFVPLRGSAAPYPSKSSRARSPRRPQLPLHEP
jgi:cell fate regulator YaaT (PSP1 superfamily)